MSTIIALVLVILLLITIAISIRVSMILTQPKRTVAELTQEQRLKFPTMKDITFRDSNNELNLNGWFFPSDNSDKTIILAHGYGHNRLLFGDKTTYFIERALDEGYNVLTFDFRASGTSEGERTSLGYYEKYDLLGAIDFAKQKGANHVALVGVSMGGATSILAAAQNPGNIDAIVSDSSFHDLKSYIYSSLPVWSNLPTFPFTFFIMPISTFMTGKDVNDVSPEKYIRNIQANKVMLIHSKSDTTTSYKSSHKLHAATNSYSLLWVITKENGPEHIEIINEYPQEYTNRVLSFISQKISDSKSQRYLGAPPEKMSELLGPQRYVPEQEESKID